MITLLRCLFVALCGCVIARMALLGGGLLFSMGFCSERVA